MPSISLDICSTLDELPGDAGVLFEATRRGDFALSREWFENLIDNGLPEGARPLVAVLSRGGATLALVPLMIARSALGSLTNCYTCCYAPLIAPDLRLAEIARVLGQKIGHLCASHPITRLDALPAEWPGLEAFIAGVADAGLAVRRFGHFGNWRETVEGWSWPQYLAARPGALRELLRRKPRQAGRRAPIEISRLSSELPAAIDAFDNIYRRSWKPVEPFPHFNAGLLKQAGKLGALRLGVLRQGGEPVAAQFWIVAGGNATVMKLAHDRAADRLSPGTLLTAAMIEALLEERVATIDFGRGDDPYKRLWASQRRQRIGLLLINPWRPRGIATLARHDLGRAIRRSRPGDASRVATAPPD